MATGMPAVAAIARHISEVPASGNEDLGVAGLVLLAQFHSIAADSEQLRHEYGSGFALLDETSLLRAAKKLGLKARIVELDASRLDKVALPAMAWQADGNHFVVAKANAEQVLIQDLVLRRPKVLTRGQFKDLYSGRMLLVTSRTTVLEGLGKDSSLVVDGVRIAMTPGMSLSAEIKTGYRPVIDYLLSPFRESGREARQTQLPSATPLPSVGC